MASWHTCSQGRWVYEFADGWHRPAQESEAQDDEIDALDIANHYSVMAHMLSRSLREAANQQSEALTQKIWDDHDCAKAWLACHASLSTSRRIPPEWQLIYAVDLEKSLPWQQFERLLQKGIDLQSPPNGQQCLFKELDQP